MWTEQKLFKNCNLNNVRGIASTYHLVMNCVNVGMDYMGIVPFFNLTEKGLSKAQVGFSFLVQSRLHSKAKIYPGQVQVCIPFSDTSSLILSRRQRK